MPTEYSLGRLNGEFVITWWENGKRRRYRLFTDSSPPELRKSRAEAERRLAEFVRDRISSEQPTIGSLWGAFVSDRAGRAIITTMGFQWRSLEAVFGNLRPDDVTNDVCRQWTAKRRAAGISDGTIWTELGNIRMVLSWAEKRRMIAHAPHVERPPKPTPKERYLTRAECATLVRSAQFPHIKLAILLMLSTAARIGAVLDLTWDRVDLERGMINLRLTDARTRKGRAVVPMNASLKAALVGAKTASVSDYVIEYAGDRVGSIKKGFSAAVALAGLNDVSPHVLRHTAAVHMAEAGIPMEEISQYLGHNSTKVTERVYARFSPGHLRRAADVLDFGEIRIVG